MACINGIAVRMHLTKVDPFNSMRNQAMLHHMHTLASKAMHRFEGLQGSRLFANEEQSSVRKVLNPIFCSAGIWSHELLPQCLHVLFSPLQ